MTLAHLSEGGYMIADNTLWDGHVLEQPRNTDAQTIGIKAFNDLVAKDERVEKVILPLRDGLTIIRKSKGVDLWKQLDRIRYPACCRKN